MAVLARHLSKTVPSPQLSFIRFAVGAVVMLLFFFARGKGPETRRLGMLFLRGLFGSAAVLTYFFAIELLGSGPATVLNYCSPIWATVFAFFFLGEKPGSSAWFGLALATAGAIQVSLSTSDAHSFNSTVGIISGVASGVLGGMAITVMRSLRNDTNAPSVFLAFSLVGLLTSSPFALTRWVPLDGHVLALVLLMGALSVVAQLLFTVALGYTSAASGSATTQLVPVLAWLLGIVLLDERFSWATLAGSAMCVTGVLLSAWRPLRAAVST